MHLPVRSVDFSRCLFLRLGCPTVYGEMVAGIDHAAVEADDFSIGVREGASCFFVGRGGVLDVVG